MCFALLCLTEIYFLQTVIIFSWMVFNVSRQLFASLGNSNPFTTKFKFVTFVNGKLNSDILMKSRELKSLNKEKTIEQNSQSLR